MAKIMRLAAVKQLAINVPIIIYGARLVHTVATTAAIYDEADNSSTAGVKKISLTVMANQLTDEVVFPQGLKFTAGCYVAWVAGEIFLTVPDEYTL